MLKHPTPAPHGGKRRGEAATVVTLLSTNSRARPPAPVAAPPLAGRVRDDGVRSRVQPGVTCSVPWVYAWQAKIAAAHGDVECGDHGFHSIMISVRGLLSVRMTQIEALRLNSLSFSTIW